MNAAKERNGKTLVYEETFRSGFPVPTQEEANRILNEIREIHSSLYGWVELEAYIDPTPEGYVAVRHHAQYK